MNITFTFDTKFGQYSDALILPDDHTLTNDELEAMKQARLNNWLDIFNNPVVMPVEIIDETAVEIPVEVIADIPVVE